MLFCWRHLLWPLEGCQCGQGQRTDLLPPWIADQGFVRSEGAILLATQAREIRIELPESSGLFLCNLALDHDDPVWIGECLLPPVCQRGAAFIAGGNQSTEDCGLPTFRTLIGHFADNPNHAPIQAIPGVVAIEQRNLSIAAFLVSGVRSGRFSGSERKLPPREAANVRLPGFKRIGGTPGIAWVRMASRNETNALPKVRNVGTQYFLANCL
jgi:hypothetical protein